MTDNNPKISAIIVAKNEQEIIEDCIKSLLWTNEIVIIDSGSTDKTLEIVGKYNTKVFKVKSKNFDEWRNEGLKKASGDWVLYIDADERVTPLLREEILKTINLSGDENNLSNNFVAYAIPRRNIILGREMRHGGWWPDYVKRLYKKNYLERWTGKLHEEPVLKGKLGHLNNPMIHTKHSDITEMVQKTNKWSEIEAQLLFKANHPKMAWWRFFRIMAGELWLRLIKYRGFLDGPEGIIYAFYQSWSKFVTYAKLWEMQIKRDTNMRMRANATNKY